MVFVDPPKPWQIHFRQVMARHGIRCLQSEPNIYICGSHRKPSTYVKSDEISIGCMTNGPPEVNDPITDDCLQELIYSQKLTVILVYVDDIDMASMLYGDNWIQQMLKDGFIVKSIGILKAEGTLSISWVASSPSWIKDLLCRSKMVI